MSEVSIACSFCRCWHINRTVFKCCGCSRDVCIGQIRMGFQGRLDWGHLVQRDGHDLCGPCVVRSE